MKEKVISAVTAVVMSAGVAGSTSLPTHNVILLDATSSNPMVANPDHARRVAGDLVGMIGSLEMRDFITVSTLGDYDVTKHPIREAEVTAKFTPNTAIRSIQTMIANFPEDVKRLPGGIQESTHILGTLEMFARRVSCGERRVRLFVLTDGQENGQALNTSPGPIYQGCAEMTMIGVIGKNPAETKKLGDAWMKWCEAAGFARCDYRS